MNKYQEIIKAAARVFKAKGYHAATVQDIASEVGILKGSLYHHIQGKEQLLAEVLMCAVNVLRDGLSMVLALDCPPEEKLKRAILFHLQAYLGHEELPVFYREVSNLSPGSRDKLNSAIKEYEDMWLKVLQDGIASSTFRGDLPAGIILKSVFGMCNWTHNWFRHDGGLSPADVGELFYRIVLEGIRKGG
ncbi:MAG: TetR/AcrR family transcriptional regulator [Bacillota bacterium]